jgi:hypothetical protein
MIGIDGHDPSPTQHDNISHRKDAKDAEKTQVSKNISEACLSCTWIPLRSHEPVFKQFHTLPWIPWQQDFLCTLRVFAVILSLLFQR